MTNDDIDAIFNAIMQHPAFDAATPGRRTRICEGLAARLTEYANDADRY